MLPIWNYLHIGRPQRTQNFTPTLGSSTESKTLKKQASLWSKRGKHDANMTLQDGHFRRLQDEGAYELHNPQQNTPPPMAIRVTTNIETSRKMSCLESNNGTIGAELPDW